MKRILIAALVLAGIAPALGAAQDTVHTSRRVDRLTFRWDTVRFATDSVRWTFIRDSVRWIVPTDSVRWLVPKDSVSWLASTVRFDTAQVHWIPSGAARRATAEYGVSTTPALQNQNESVAFAQHLFPPELVMQHQSRLKLTEQQRNTIVQEINRLQATAVNVQWRVADESEKLSELLSRDSVAEAAALGQVNKVIEYETVVKRAQLAMLIRIRNVLTAEQRAILRNLPKPAK